MMMFLAILATIMLFMFGSFMTILYIKVMLRAYNGEHMVDQIRHYNKTRRRKK